MNIRNLVAALAAVAVLTGLTTPASAVIETDRRTIEEASGVYSTTSISDDGRWVVTGDGDSGRIRLHDTASGTSQVVTETGASPVLSGDGRWVAYNEYVDGKFDVFLWDRVTTNVENLSSSSRVSAYPSISDDGAVVVWRDAPADIGSRFIRVWRRSTGMTEDFTTSSGIPLVSGNGRYLFYAPTGDSLRRDLLTGAEVELTQFPQDVADDGITFVYVRPNPGFAAGNGVGVQEVGDPDGAVEIDVADDFGIGPENVLISGDGSTVFVHARPDLIPSDTNEQFDTYRWLPATGSLDFITDREDSIRDVSHNGAVLVGIARIAGTNDSIFVRTELDGPEMADEPDEPDEQNVVPDQVAVADLAEDQLRDQVGRLYEAFFLRPPDAQGLAFWTERRSSGWTVSRMAENFVQSPEFVDRYGELSDTEFVELIYRNLFERSPDSSGGPFWTNQLAGGVGRGVVMVEFSESAEYIGVTGTSTPSPAAAHQIWRLYRAYLGRDADQAGFDFWYTLQANGRSLDSISDAFAASDEFVQTYGSLSNADFVDLIYRNVLGRTPEAEGRAFWIGQLDAGRSRGSVMTAFSESPEYIRSTGTLPG